MLLALWTGFNNNVHAVSFCERTAVRRESGKDVGFSFCSCYYYYLSLDSEPLVERLATA